MNISDADAKRIAKELKMDTKRFKLADFKKGMRVELEHGPKKKGGISNKTDVTGGNLLKTGKVALAHMLEDVKYYDKLAIMEKKNGKKKGYLSKRESKN